MCLSEVCVGAFKSCQIDHVCTREYHHKVTISEELSLRPECLTCWRISDKNMAEAVNAMMILLLKCMKLCFFFLFTAQLTSAVQFELKNLIAIFLKDM